MKFVVLALVTTGVLVCAAAMGPSALSAQEAPVRWQESFGKWTVRRNDRECDLWGSPNRDVEVILTGNRGGRLHIIAVGPFDIPARFEKIPGTWRTRQTGGSEPVLWEVGRRDGKVNLHTTYEEGARWTSQMTPAEGFWIDASWYSPVADPDPQFGLAVAKLTTCLN